MRPTAKLPWTACAAAAYLLVLFRELQGLLLANYAPVLEVGFVAAEDYVGLLAVGVHLAAIPNIRAKLAFNFRAPPDLAAAVIEKPGEKEPSGRLRLTGRAF